MKRQVFVPLELSEAGFGPPKSSDATLEQPRGHRAVLAGKISVDDKADNTPIIGPAATVHMTLRNLCTFATEHLRGDRGAGKLLSANTYKLLHTPALDHYACGWLRRDPSPEIPLHCVLAQRIEHDVVLRSWCSFPSRTWSSPSHRTTATLNRPKRPPGRS